MNRKIFIIVISIAIIIVASVLLLFIWNYPDKLYTTITMSAEEASAAQLYVAANELKITSIILIAVAIIYIACIVSLILFLLRRKREKRAADDLGIYVGREGVKSNKIRTPFTTINKQLMYEKNKFVTTATLGEGKGVNFNNETIASMFKEIASLEDERDRLADYIKNSEEIWKSRAAT